MPPRLEDVLYPLLEAAGVRRTGEGSRRGVAAEVEEEGGRGAEAAAAAAPPMDSGLALLCSTDAAAPLGSSLPTARSIPPTASRRAALRDVMSGKAIPPATASSMLVIDDPFPNEPEGGDAIGGRTGSMAVEGVGFGGRATSGEVATSLSWEGGGTATGFDLAEILMPLKLRIVSSSMSSSPCSGASLLLVSAPLWGLVGNVALTGTALPNAPLPTPR